jgi:FKBP-type peptidyl-prolyl cis-trans isomerase FklB
MKKYFLLFSLFGSTLVYAQKPAAKPVAKKPVSSSPLKNRTDSMSYAVGMNLANFYKQQNIKNMNSAMVAKAINDAMSGSKSLLTEEQANLVLMRVLNPDVFKKIEAGEKFLAENKKKSGVKTTASGLQYEVIRQGDGIRPTAADTVEVNYAGTLIDGFEFDNSYKRGQSISFPLNGVIRGWTEGLQLMAAGSKYKFYVPQQLGYGMNDMGSIPGGSVLVFEIELLNVKKKQ